MILSYLSLGLFGSLICPTVQARTWTDIVSAEIYESAPHDPNRIKFKMERDPLAPPTIAPTSPPSTETPVEPTLAPSAAPTARWEHDTGNGGCPVGFILHEIRMHDVYGDGWDNTFLQIYRTKVQVVSSHTSNARNEENATFFYSSVEIDETTTTLGDMIYNGTLTSGHNGYTYVCLETFQCYNVMVGGGQWLDEVKWEVRKVPLGVSEDDRRFNNELSLIKGIAPDHCAFSIPSGDGDFTACTPECGLHLQNTEEGESIHGETTRVPTSSPTTTTSEMPIETTKSEDTEATFQPTQSPTSNPTVEHGPMETNAPSTITIPETPPPTAISVPETPSPTVEEIQDTEPVHMTEDSDKDVTTLPEM